MVEKCILIADDDPLLRRLLVLALKSAGYGVLVAKDGYELIQIAKETLPDLLLVDLMMPIIDGYEAIRQLRNDTRTAHIPMVILTAQCDTNDVVVGFETGADDYITKPFRTDELLARINRHLLRAAQRPVHNPLTGLAGNILLSEELKYRMRRQEPFALLYIDIDNFKAFNDQYGFTRGDRMIRLLADVMIEAVTQHTDNHAFIGHIGGDDFAVITAIMQLHSLADTLVKLFDRRAQTLYEPDDLARGYLEGTDRHGVTRRFPITTLSIGIVVYQDCAIQDHEEISRLAAEMKQIAKQQPVSSYAVGDHTTR